MKVVTLGGTRWLVRSVRDPCHSLGRLWVALVQKSSSATGVARGQHAEKSRARSTSRRMAVAVGFEPTVRLPPRAFEARSFGRSDTPPRRRVQGGS